MRPFLLKKHIATKEDRLLNVFHRINESEWNKLFEENRRSSVFHTPENPMVKLIINRWENNWSPKDKRKTKLKHLISYLTRYLTENVASKNYPPEFKPNDKDLENTKEANNRLVRFRITSETNQRVILIEYIIQLWYNNECIF